MGMEYFSQPSAESGAGQRYLSLYSMFCSVLPHGELSAPKMADSCGLVLVLQCRRDILPDFSLPSQGSIVEHTHYTILRRENRQEIVNIFPESPRPLPVNCCPLLTYVCFCGIMKPPSDTKADKQAGHRPQPALRFAKQFPIRQERKLSTGENYGYEHESSSSYF